MQPRVCSICGIRLSMSLQPPQNGTKGVLQTGKHGYLIDVVELAIVLTFEAGPQIRDKYLSSLVKAYTLSVE